jgi:hypothetical protein
VSVSLFQQLTVSLGLRTKIPPVSTKDKSEADRF